MRAGPGLASGILDADYEAAGASVGDNVDQGRRRGAQGQAAERRRKLAGYKKGALVIAIMDPYGNEAASSRWRTPAFWPLPWS